MGAKYRKSGRKVSFNQRGLILCEGKTEENYFKGLIHQDRYKRKFAAIDVAVFVPKDHSPVGLVKKAKEKIKEAKRARNDYDFVWVIFDRNGHAKIPDAFEIARNARPEIKIVFSIPCFEYFVLLHFEKTTRPFHKCDDVISRINKKFLPGYEKTSNLFTLLLPHMETGMKNSKWVEEQMQSDIKRGRKIYELSAFSGAHILIDYLYALL